MCLVSTCLSDAPRVSLAPPVQRPLPLQPYVAQPRSPCHRPPRCYPPPPATAPCLQPMPPGARPPCRLAPVHALPSAAPCPSSPSALRIPMLHRRLDLLAEALARVACAKPPPPSSSKFAPLPARREQMRRPALELAWDELQL